MKNKIPKNIPSEAWRIYGEDLSSKANLFIHQAQISWEFIRQGRPKDWTPVSEESTFKLSFGKGSSKLIKELKEYYDIGISLNCSHGALHVFCVAMIELAKIDGQDIDVKSDYFIGE